MHANSGSKLSNALKNERHANHSETMYWLDQYKQIAIQSQAELVDSVSLAGKLCTDNVELIKKLEAAEAKLKEISESPVVAFVRDIDSEISYSADGAAILKIGDDLILRPTIKE